MGRQVKTLINGFQTPGYKSVQWNATNNQGEPVSAGMYIYTIQVGDFRATKKMVLLK
jgi:flagellar hook assembly protein FlgD